MLEITPALLSLGAKPTPERLYPWTQQIPLGELGVNVNSVR